MKLSSKGRYAVMALADIARFNNNLPISLRDISIRQNISLVYLEQLFLKLLNHLNCLVQYITYQYGSS